MPQPQPREGKVKQPFAVRGNVTHRLSEVTGSILDEEILSAEAPSENDNNEYTRNAILVHEGTFKSLDGEISFDEAKLSALVTSHNQRLERLAADYGGIEKMPRGAFPPLQLDHDTAADKTIGRLTGMVELRRMDIPGVGRSKCAIVGPVTFLGKENVDKAKDGRYYNLSIGYSGDRTRLISELTVITFPAAEGAMLMGRGKEKTMPTPGFKDYRTKRLAKIEERKTRLGDIKKQASETTTKLQATVESLRLAAKTNKITTRLGKILEEGKMTPAEFKKVDMKRLAAMDDKDLDLVMEAYGNREGMVVKPGQIGTANADVVTDLARLAEERKEFKLLKETAEDLTKLGAKLKDDGEIKKRLQGKKDAADKENEKFDQYKAQVDKIARLAAGDQEQEGDKKSPVADQMSKMKAHLAEAMKAHESKDFEKVSEHLVHMAGCYKEMEHMGYSLGSSDAAFRLGVLGPASDIRGKEAEDTLHNLESQVAQLTVMIQKQSDQIDALMQEEAQEHDELTGMGEADAEGTDLENGKPGEPGSAGEGGTGTEPGGKPGEKNLEGAEQGKDKDGKDLEKKDGEPGKKDLADGDGKDKDKPGDGKDKPEPGEKK